MIKANKNGVKYCSFYNATIPMLNHLGEKQVLKILKSMPIKFKLPKNTLKVKYINHFIGYNSDDFVKNVKTVCFYYMVHTFKR